MSEWTDERIAKILADLVVSISPDEIDVDGLDIITQMLLNFTELMQLQSAQRRQHDALVDAINTIYQNALKCGETFRFCRVGEDHHEATKMRLELEEPYNELANAIDRAYELTTGEKS